MHNDLPWSEAGGGLFVDAAGSARLEAVTVYNATASGMGGCGAFDRSSATVISTTCVNCHAPLGGGLHVGGRSNIEFDSVRITRSSATNGSAIFVNSSSLGCVNSSISSGGQVVVFRENNATVAGGGIYIVGEPSEIRGLVVENSSAQFGGGVFVSESELTKLEQLIITQNFAASAGGGMFTEASTVVSAGVTVSNNRADIRGGGLHVVDTDLSGTTISISNSAQSGGGVSTTGIAELKGMILMDNFADAAGGGLAAAFGSLTLRNVSINNCTASTGVGGGMSAEDVAITVEDLVVFKCSSRRGGGVYLNSSSLMAAATSYGASPGALVDNTADYAGGGAFIGGVDALLSDVQVYRSMASLGGGIAAEGAKTCTISRVAIMNSSASTVGGGMYIGIDSECVIQDLVVSGNEASESGGGLAVHDSLVYHSNVSIAENIAEMGGGVYVISDSLEAKVVMLDRAGAIASLALSNAIRAPPDNGANAALECSYSCELSGMVITGGNTTLGMGGGLYVTGDGDATITNTVLANNYAAKGGAIAVFGQVNVGLESVGILNNQAAYGGGVWTGCTSSAFLTSATNCVLYNNSATSNGGAVFVRASKFSASDTLIVENRAGDATSGYGGGLHSEAGGASDVYTSLFMRNRAYYGSSVAGLSASATTLNLCNVSGNDNGFSATWSQMFKDLTGSDYDGWQAIQSGAMPSKQGGLLYVSDSDTGAQITECVFSDGSAESGGAVYARDQALFVAVGSTFYSNFASQAGGGLSLSGGSQAYVESSTITLSSTYFGMLSCI